MSENCFHWPVKVTGEIEVKRFWTNGAHIEIVCPRCGSEICEELDGDAINWPSLGKPYRYDVYCKQCDDFYLSTELVFEMTVRTQNEQWFEGSD